MERLEHIKQLYRTYVANAISDADKRRLMDFFATCTDAELQDVIGPLLPAEVEDLKDLSAYDSRAERILERVRHWTTDEKPVARRPKRLWLPYAAAVLLVASVVGYFALDSRKSPVDSLVATDIAPGGNRATLTLADGRTIDLSEAQHGIVVGDGITYLDGSAVVGEQVSMGTSEPVPGTERNHKFTSSQVHTLTTPKGGTYQITLPDGTKVWLNAGSTLKYPSRFAAAERVVELTGEAYFDVSEQVSEGTSEHGAAATHSQAPRLTSSHAHKFTNSQKVPFKVVTAGQTVEVLGTEFNISAYADDPETKTTLVTGRVRVAPVTDHWSPVTMKPGEQAIVRDAASEIRQVDVNDFIAWKNGYIVITNATLADVIAQVERWYDVDFKVRSQSDVTAYVSLNRMANLSEVLEALELNYGIKFKIEGRRVIERE